MTLGRTTDNKIKIKTDGGLRAIECACCGGVIYGIPCADCPPFLGDFNFSLTGDQVEGLTEYESPSAVCPSDNCNFAFFPDIPPRTCSDSWFAFSNSGYGLKTFGITINRGQTNGVCVWALRFQVSGPFQYEIMGSPDVCFLNEFRSVDITSLNPAGSYSFTFSVACVPPFMGPPTDFNFTVTIS